MGLLGFLFSRRDSTKPEDYDPIYVKWEKDGKEYGPYDFEKLVSNHWSGPPVIGRFARERKWRGFDRLLRVLGSLKASKDQIAFLREHGIGFDESALGFLEARELIGRRQDEMNALHAAERKEKEKLPATRQYRKKMDGLGIKYPDDVTRAQAKELVAGYESCARSKEELKVACAKLKRRDIVVPAVVKEHIATEIGKDQQAVVECLEGPSWVVDETADDYMDVLEFLESLSLVVDETAELGVELEPPESFDAGPLGEYVSRLEEALAEAEELEDFLKDREICARDDVYRLVGRLPASRMKAAKRDVIERYLRGEWNFENNVVECIRTHFPDARLKSDYD